MPQYMTDYPEDKFKMNLQKTMILKFTAGLSTCSGPILLAVLQLIALLL